LAAIAPIAAETTLDNITCMGNNQPYISQRAVYMGIITISRRRIREVSLNFQNFQGILRAILS